MYLCICRNQKLLHAWERSLVLCSSARIMGLETNMHFSVAVFLVIVLQHARLCRLAVCWTWVQRAPSAVRIGQSTCMVVASHVPGLY